VDAMHCMDLGVTGLQWPVLWWCSLQTSKCGVAVRARTGSWRRMAASRCGPQRTHAIVFGKHGRFEACIMHKPA